MKRKSGECKEEGGGGGGGCPGWGGVGWGEYFKAGQRVCLPRRASRYQRKSEKNKSTEGYDPAD